jgi:hypothetical protein
MNRIVAGIVACEETAEVIVLCLSHFLHRSRPTMREAMLSDRTIIVKRRSKQGQNKVFS